MDLFEHAADRDMLGAPLAERMRPRTLEEVVGQEHLIGPGRLIARAVAEDRVPSLVMWGPPGSGKTTLARVIAASTGCRFESFSAVLGGVKEVRAIIEEARKRLSHERRRTILFVDEIHRFNKAQQDAFLPSVERGTVVLIGATTENPSFSVISALLSRCQVIRLEPLTDEHLRIIVRRAADDDVRGLGQKGLDISEETVDAVVAAAGGDGRRALTVLEIAADLARGRPEAALTPEDVEQAAGSRRLLYDKAGEEHYTLASAFIKSMRGSDPDAAIYWMIRMLDAGEDPLFLTRRMLIFASEDVGNADPRALQLAAAADHAVRHMGLPEGIYPLTQAAAFLAVAAKSNATVRAIQAVRADIAAHGTLPVPMHLRNASTDLMKSWGYGDGYQYPHDHEGGWVEDQYLPDALAGKTYYEPTNRGLEAQIGAKLVELRKGRRRPPGDDEE